MERIVALVGPTAVGKTDVSIELARGLNAEIVACDSMQVYRRMRRLTTQPTDDQRAAVRHHLIDCLEPTEPFDVARYRRAAREAIRDMGQRSKAALIVGGTGLYLKALQRGLCEAPAEQPAVRERLLAAIREQGTAVSHDRLRRVDPVAAAKIHPNDSRRIVRALEVFEVSGRPLSSFWDHGEDSVRIDTIGLMRDRAELYERINRRVERMIRDEAVLDEARALSALPMSRTASQVHGLRFVRAYLSGELSCEDAIGQWQRQVRRYARRQMTWFRADGRIRWVGVSPAQSARDVAERVLAALGDARVALSVVG